ncbi:hypothetical protein GAP31_043A [Cronobacter phage vB_CsaM_GAP31]|uniref:Uncharacterized protein n=1 Tax=Cronobacter phage vB_CsaM_GAP31 TaxID=1141135 RepID=K4FAU8_9CAUD|nr:hypothetical protein GAP31_043A [Cronobacter phage vB_CsaM_GAP31]AFC21224.1 hypothetical protein GAP31_043A [Cronobacter phage vB_CsaM_GAP31]
MLIVKEIHRHECSNYVKIPEMLNPFYWLLSLGTRSLFRFRNRIFSIPLKKFFSVEVGFSIDFSKSRSYFFSLSKKFSRPVLDRLFSFKNVFFL